MRPGCLGGRGRQRAVSPAERGGRRGLCGDTHGLGCSRRSSAEARRVAGRLQFKIFFLGRYGFLWETSVGGRGAAEGGGGGVRRGGAHPEPPSGRASRSAPLTWGTQHSTPGRCKGPAGAALLAVGGLPPTPPPRAVASAMRWVWLCTEHIAAPDRCSGSTAPAPSWPAARGPAGPGCPAPLRPALEGSRVPACLTRPGSQVLGRRPGRWNPSPSPIHPPGPAERGVEVSVLGQVCGKGNRGAAGASSVRAERVRRCVRILGAARALGLPGRDRGGWVE